MLTLSCLVALMLMIEFSQELSPCRENDNSIEYSLYERDRKAAQLSVCKFREVIESQGRYAELLEEYKAQKLKVMTTLGERT